MDMEGDDDDSYCLPQLLEDVKVSTLYRHTLYTWQPAAAFI